MGVEERGIWTDTTAIKEALAAAGVSYVQFAAMVTALQLIDNMISGSRGLVTEDNSATILTALQLIDNMISGSEAQVDVVAALPAGSNLIGKVSEPATVETPFTGIGNLVASTSKIAPAAAFKLTEIVLHLNAAPTTSTQNLVISVDDGVGSTYDENILTIDLVANAITDLVIKPDKVCKSTDVITAAWTNTDGKTYGLKFKYQLL